MNRKLYLHLAVIIFAFANLTCFAAEALDCIRAKPEPIVKTTNVVKNYSFLSTSKQEASESFTLLSGAAVNIVHSGCEKIFLEVSV